MLVFTTIFLACTAVAFGDYDKSGYTHGASWSIPGGDGYGSDGRPAATVSFNMGVSSGQSGYSRPSKGYGYVAPSYERTSSYSSGRPLKVVAHEAYGSSRRYGSSYQSQPVYSRPAVSYQAPVIRTYSRPAYRQETVSSYEQPATIYREPVVSTYSKPRVTYQQPTVYREPVVVVRKEVPTYNQYSSYTTVAARPRAPTVILNAGTSYGTTYDAASRTYAEPAESYESYSTPRIIYGARPRKPTVVLSSGYGSRPAYSSSGPSYGSGAVVSSTIYGAPSAGRSYGGDDYGVSHAPVVRRTYGAPASYDSYEQDRY